MPLHAHVAHHIPGRIRVKLPRARGRPQLLRQFQDAISTLPGVEHVRINPVTGSMLIRYDPDQYADFHSRLAKHGETTNLFTLPLPELQDAEEIARNIEAEAEFLAEHSETANALVNWVKRLNEDVRRATNNTVDLRVLLPLGLAIYSFSAVKREESSTPLWVTLGIFSFNSFVALHRETPITAKDVAPVPASVTPTRRRRRATG